CGPAVSFAHGARNVCLVRSQDRATNRGRHIAYRPTLTSYPHGHLARIRLTPWTGHLGIIATTPRPTPDKVESCLTHGNNGKVKSSMGSSRCFDTYADPNTAQ